MYPITSNFYYKSEISRIIIKMFYNGNLSGIAAKDFLYNADNQYLEISHLNFWG